MKESPPRGRRSGQPETRTQIREAARRLFLAHGYDAVTLRAIATEAGVDVALVSYYFGAKKQLFAEVMALPVNPAVIVPALVAEGLDGLGERAVRRLLAVWDDPEAGAALRALAQLALTDPDTGRVVREVVQREILGSVAGALKGRRREERAAGFVVHMSGLIFSRYVLALEPMASMPAEEVVRTLAPAIQLTLAGG